MTKPSLDLGSRSPAFARLVSFFRSKGGRGVLPAGLKAAPAKDVTRLREAMPEAHLEPLWAMYDKWNGTGESKWFSIDPNLVVPYVRWDNASLCLDNSQRYAPHYGGTSENPPYAFFGYFDGGCLLGIERATAEVWYFDPISDGESARRVLLARSLEEWLSRLADLVERKERVWNEEEGKFDTPKLSEDLPERPARELTYVALINTLQTLVETRALSMSAPPTAEESERIQNALNKRGFAARAKALRVAFGTLTGVTVHASDDELESVLRLLG